MFKKVATLSASLLVLAMGAMPAAAIHEEGFEREGFEDRITGTDSATPEPDSRKPVKKPARTTDDVLREDIQTREQSDSARSTLLGDNYRVGAYIQLDYRKIDQHLRNLDDQTVENHIDNNFDARRARLEMMTRTNSFHADLSLEAASELTLKDAFVDWRIHPYFQLQFGQFKSPLGNEALGPSEYAIYHETSSMAGIFSGQRDRGLMVHNEVNADMSFFYNIGFVNGAPENESDNNQKLDMVGCFALHSSSDGGYWDTWFSAGFQTGEQTATADDEIVLYSPNNSDLALFTYDILETYDYQLDKFSLDIIIQRGRFLLNGEYMRNIHRFDEPVIIDGGQTTVSYFITQGRHILENGYINGQRVKSEAWWGSLEIALRYGWFKIDELYFNPNVDLYPGAATAQPEQMQNGSSATLALNWYLRPGQKISLNYTEVDAESVTFEGDPTPARNVTESSVSLRLQSSF